MQRKADSSASGFPATFVVLPTSVDALDLDSARAADELYAGGASGNVVRIGGVMVPEGVFYDELAPPLDHPTRVPGVCKPREPESPNVSDSTVPSGVGTFRSLGVGDLLVVRQRLLRYELGEIAHVENVMQTESRHREHRRLTRIEETLVQETEVTRESEHDLETTQRFELQRESEETIAENASRQAGVTVTASYGFSVEVAANAGFTSDTSRTESERISSAQAREITERSVQRLQERIREERTRRVINEVEETNRHGFENKSGPHVSGIYRWLDKVYEAQVYNYGKREILEVVVPEPAAFVRHAAARRPIEGLALYRPEPPGFCAEDRAEFVPLEPKDITPHSYKLWVTRYQVASVKPPPPTFRILGTAFDQPWASDEAKAVAASHKELKVPPGYVAKRAWKAGTAAHHVYDDNDAGHRPVLKLYAGRHELGGGATVMNNEEDVVPIAIVGILLLVYGVTVEVECALTKEALEVWQLQTYSAIMAAYRDQLTTYEEQRKAAAEAVDQRVALGRHPEANRVTARTELKKAAISQLTGHHYDEFDAMRRNVAPHGFPQTDLAEADQEGQYIQFIEQAFEWENMQYLFYPYFWGRKAEWPTISQLDDPDPLFAEFLRAGAARVNVPVRPGFEVAVNTFLSTGRLPWSADDGDTTSNDDELFLSIAEEMRAQQGAIHTKSGGTISVDNGGTAVTGVGTSFTEDDVRRDITIRGEVYRIQRVDSETQLALSAPFRGADLAEGGYVIGAKAVGEPWVLRLPTSLVLLQDTPALPIFTSDG